MWKLCELKGVGRNLELVRLGGWEVLAFILPTWGYSNGRKLQG
jgi:hypothetical protein